MENTTAVLPSSAPTVPLQDQKTDLKIIKTSDFGCIVKYLPLNYSLEQVTGLFSPYGTVVGVKLIKNHISGASQGYGFVYYENQKAAEDAVANLNGKQIDSKVIRVSVADKLKHQEVQRSNVYVAGLPKTYSKADLDTLFGKFGRVVESRVLVDTQGQPRGVGFVRFDSYANAQASINQMNNTIPPGGNEQLIVKLARDKDAAPPVFPPGAGGRGGRFSQNNFSSFPMGNSFPSSAGPSQGDFYRKPFGGTSFPAPAQPYSPYDQNSFMQQSATPSYGMQGNTGYGMPQQAQQMSGMGMGMNTGMGMGNAMAASTGAAATEGVQLFVFHLPGEYKEEDLYKLFSHYGTVLSVKIVCDQGSALSRGYGFVNMASQQEATQAIYALNGFRLGNKYLKVDFKVAR
jgi:ELAV-like protein 1